MLHITNDSVDCIVRKDLQHRNVCTYTRWIPRLLVNEHKNTLAGGSFFLGLLWAKGREYLETIVTTDEILFLKRNNFQYDGVTPRRKNRKNASCRQNFGYAISKMFCRYLDFHKVYVEEISVISLLSVKPGPDWPRRGPKAMQFSGPLFTRLTIISSFQASNNVRQALSRR